MLIMSVLQLRYATAVRAMTYARADVGRQPIEAEVADHIRASSAILRRRHHRLDDLRRHQRGIEVHTFRLINRDIVEYRGDGRDGFLERGVERDARAAEQTLADRLHIELEQLGNPSKAAHRGRIAEEPGASGTLTVVDLDLAIATRPF